MSFHGDSQAPLIGTATLFAVSLSLTTGVRSGVRLLPLRFYLLSALVHPRHGDRYVDASQARALLASSPLHLFTFLILNSLFLYFIFVLCGISWKAPPLPTDFISASKKAWKRESTSWTGHVFLPSSPHLLPPFFIPPINHSLPKWLPPKPDSASGTSLRPSR